MDNLLNMKKLLTLIFVAFAFYSQAQPIQADPTVYIGEDATYADYYSLTTATDTLTISSSGIASPAIKLSDYDGTGGRLAAFDENGTLIRTAVDSALSAVGDVDGPASSTDNAITRFDGTTGKIIQNSSVVIDDEATNSTSINMGTVDGSDNKFLSISAGGGATTSRGAYITLSGLEHGQAGVAAFASGTGAAMNISSGANINMSPTAGSRVNITGNLSLGTVTMSTPTNTIGIANGTVPSSSPINAVQLYAEDVSASSELKVRDEAGNITVLSDIGTNFVPYVNAIANIDLNTRNLTTTGTITGGAGSFTTLNASGDVAFDTDGFYWDESARRLGIGTNSPEYILQLNESSSSSSAVRLIQAGSGGAFLSIHVPEGGGDPQIGLGIDVVAGDPSSTTVAWHFGIDNSDDNIFKFSSNAIGQTGKDKLFIDHTNGDYQGLVGINRRPSYAIDAYVDDALLNAFIGSIKDGTNEINAFKFGIEHYTDGEEPIWGMFQLSQSTTNTVNIGGGSSSGNAATDINFYTAANNTTTTGTLRGGFNLSGDFNLVNNLTIGGTTAISSARVSTFTQTNTDNTRLDGNTLSSTDTNGNLNIDPNGTGDVFFKTDNFRVYDNGVSVGESDVLNVGTYYGRGASNGFFLMLEASQGSNDMYVTDDAETFSEGGYDVTYRTSGGTESTIYEKTKTINIGDWDMDATATVNVAHGLGTSWINIRTVQVKIFDDGVSAQTDLTSGFAGSAAPAGYVQTGSTNIVLTRYNASAFDAPDYNATSFNRGYVTITYTTTCTGGAICP